jgi:hypothetical protein
VGDTVVMLGAEITEKEAPLLVPPFAATRTLPLDAPEGTGTVMLDVLQSVGAAAMPLNLTPPPTKPCDAPKLLPLIVTVAPIGALLGTIERIAGAGRTTKPKPLLDKLPSVTTTFPLDAPAGTGTVIAFILQTVGVPATPLKVTVLPP